MSITVNDLFIAFNLPPEEAVKYFQAKGFAITWDWHEMLERAHDTAFTVAKATNLEVLQTIRDQVDRIFTEGITNEEFNKILEPKLKELGWWGNDVYLDANNEPVPYTKGSRWRLNTIYQTNASVGYSTGRFNEQLENIEFQPYWEYVAIFDGATRPLHRQMSGLIFRADDPFWANFYPPNGWRCRCRVVAHSASFVEGRGIQPISSENQLRTEIVVAGTDKRTGEVRQSEVTVFQHNGYEFKTDVGWNQNPAFNQYQPDLSSYDADLVGVYKGLLS